LRFFNAIFSISNFGSAVGFFAPYITTLPAFLRQHAAETQPPQASFAQYTLQAP